VRTSLFLAIAQQIVVIPYHYSLRNSPEEHSSHLLGGGSLKSCIELFLRYVFHTGLRIRHEMAILPNMYSVNIKFSVHIVISVKYKAIGMYFVVHSLFRPYIG
jgi:hypothetical protein